MGKDFKLIVVGDNGAARLVSVSLRRVIGVAVFMAVALVMGFGANYTSPDPLSADVVDAWQQKLQTQQNQLLTLEQESANQAEAAGRQLAIMQARLVRMEALGTRVTEVADLDEGEFVFSEPPSLGGPVSSPQTSPSWGQLNTDLSQLADNIDARGQELTLLASMLSEREYRNAALVAGRPVKFGWQSSAFGKRLDPISGKEAWHKGVDFAGKNGSDVIAVASGVVVFAGKRSGFGKLVEINHGDGYTTRYAHHADVFVKPGDIVKKGQVVGSMGSSGRSTGPHVHFEVLKNGRNLDPAKYVARQS